MTARIRSLLASGPLMVALNSGRTVRLSPGCWSADLRDAEVADNAHLDKLRRRGDIEVEQSDGEPEGPADQGDIPGGSKPQRSRKRPGAAG
ncbi:hypothetical protein [Streptomyces griseorubiginosus]|uniref:hypothetical protein n=1 Tax=Streptomyces griseorubiginosus TaxID=67304 RepID=UPI00365A1983